ncbi:ExeM/NucH family extracellular endonuclease [Rhodophyticola sp. CCM32]|uniref:ExeM/NucH family extracellular endonuclease n=1 Tax=Rhodophyticola sp. CCM32 TaxID=2916397 RepID=UPI00107FC0C5|nr:ExeM/NucH family extracellular endonuclease [Rhodophyticola sp. CCM32]QBY01230.1 ExeM/NucH family extracellular endonuclease [Rhodophyticola sp. CCM32]
MGLFWRVNPFLGSWRHDDIDGSSGRDIIFGFRGDDLINPSAGNDTVFAGSGNDTVAGSEGDDFIDGGRGFELVTYEGGIDDYQIDQTGWGFFQRVTVTSLTTDLPDAGRDVLTRVEALYFAEDDYTLFLNGRNNAVLAGDDAVTTDEDATLVLAAAELLGNDQEFDGDMLDIIDVSTTSAAGAAVTLSDGQVTYDPGLLFQGLGTGETATDTFTYTVDDGRGGADTATVTVTVTGQNDAPLLTADTDITIDENTTVIPANITASDADVNDTLTFSIAGGADAALFQINAMTGELGFITAPDFEAPADAGQDNIYDVVVGVTDGTDPQSVAVAVTVADVEEIDARINEIHYDNDGGDVGEFVEIRVGAGQDASGLLVEFYRDSGTVYDSASLPATPASSDDAFDYYLIERPTNGIQNGAADGIALSQNGAVIELLSYEGTLTATEGTATGVTSTDIGVFEPGDTPVGQSLQRNEDGTWRGPELETRGAENTPPAPELVITEIMQNPSAVSDANGEYFEIFNAGASSVDINGWTISDAGSDNHMIDNGGPLTIAPGEYLVLGANSDQASNGGVAVDYEYSGVTLANGDDEIILTDGDGVEIDRVAYDGGPDFPDPTGASMELIATDLDNDVGANWTTATDAFGDGDLGTPGAENTGGIQNLAVWEIQGSGNSSQFTGQQVTVSAVVTYILGNGFFLQEEDADADGDLGTSDGIFVFTGGAPTVAVGDLADVTGIVTEFGANGSTDTETQLSNASVTIVSAGNAMPTPGELGLSPMTTEEQMEALEGMLFNLSSGVQSEEITIIENFNFDRFGEILVSAGVQTQATQLFDAQTQQADVQQTIADNAANRLIIDDGAGGQNPSEFGYIANTGPGDDGDGILDAEDTFGAAGPTVRLGAEIDGPTTGVMRQVFDEYTMLVDGTLNIDPATNEGARPASPASEYTGDMQIGAFNVLNYFTTIDGGNSGPTTLGGLRPRGADNPDELVRQTDKLVDALLGSEVEIFALQEIENGGFAEGSAIDTLTDALNEGLNGVGATGPYAFVNPTGVTAPGDTGGLIGTDAISTGIIYDTRAVNLVHSEALVFAESSAATTFSLTEDLAALLGPGFENPVGDFQRNRPMVTASFEDKATGEVFSVASVHFKSKGDSGLEDLVEDAEAFLLANDATLTQMQKDTINDAITALLADPNYDQGDGQGFWNQVRADAASEAYSFLTAQYDVFGDGTQLGTQNYLITGDFNAYSQEDPVQAITDQADTDDLLAEFVGADAYSFVFNGQRGALDQVISSSGLGADVQGVFEWHINADEPDLLNYDNSFNDPRFYSADAFASSDHDPAIVDITLDGVNPDTLLLG